MSAEEIKRRMRKHADECGSQRLAAKEAGVSASFFSDVLSGRREISDKLARAYCCRRVVTYERMDPKP